ncbi:cupin domain-containing protein [Duganella phyllosphaerae]|uniref:Cupin domain protein n=1 Tax=Duganella phyllosphaerae TaxID=762836 RepID=A0A1E7WZE1_9BURK|nr:cupin domain-containing protein [Duganella phyllosphaerae]OFA05400.1 cupin domain protein [Duganella phyllosphaerae]
MYPISTPSHAKLLRPSALPLHDRGGGARTVALVSPALGATTFISGITEFDPGTEIPFHSHNCEESVVLFEGDAVMDIDGREYALQPLDTTFIPANVVHRFRNVSHSKPMKILWTYASPQATRTLRDNGEIRAVALEHGKQ